jgi:outer membrane receptor protein involved in Fe transport
VIAKGYFLLDAVVNYNVKRLTFGIIIQNLLNAEWNEAQFDTLSRLKSETTAVDELHFTPGTPFFLKGCVSYSF